MIVSKNSKELVYHEENCPYAKRISKKYSRYISEGSAIELGYKPCAYCGGLHGLYIKLKNDPKMFAKARYGLSESYDRIDKALCFRTEIGFWKILESNDGEYKLWHLNHGQFEESIPDKCLMRRYFHRQADVKATKNIGRVMQYISDHDKAKKIMNEDWRKLPKSTQKQRRYFKQAKKREQRKQSKRLDELFEKLKKGEL